MFPRLPLSVPSEISTVHSDALPSLHMTIREQKSYSCTQAVGTVPRSMLKGSLRPGAKKLKCGWIITPSQGDPIRPAEQSSKMKVGESFSHPVRPKPLLGHQTGNAVVPEMTGTVFFNYDGEGVGTWSFLHDGWKGTDYAP